MKKSCPSLLPSSPNTKLLITSATIDGQKFSHYFADAPLINVEADKRYPVETRVRRLEKYEHHSQAAISEAIKCVDEFARQGFIMVNPQQNPVDPFIAKEGTIIVFLPGKEDITKGKRDLDEYVAQLGAKDTIEVLTCHSEVSDVERDKVKAPTRKGVLRIVCATDIVRSSVTPPTTIGVIDSLQVKRRHVDARGVTHLRKITIPGALADQGKGRGGRQNPSFYIPISSEFEYEEITRRHDARYWPLPQIVEDSVVSVALQFAAFGISLRDADLMDKPSPEKINQAIIRLQKIGALDEAEKITELGDKLRQFPIDPERAKVLITAEKLGVLPEAIVATAIIENEGIFFKPGRSFDYLTVSERTAKRILLQLLKDIKDMGYTYGYDVREKVRAIDFELLSVSESLAALTDITPPEIKQKRSELKIVEKIHTLYPEYTPLLVISRSYDERWLISGGRTEDGNFVPYMIPMHLPESGYQQYKGEYSLTLNEPSRTLQQLQKRFKQQFSHSLLIEVSASAGVEQSTVAIEELNRQKLIDDQPTHQGVFTGYEYADGSGILVYMKSSPTDERWELKTIDPTTWLVTGAKNFNGSKEFRFIGSVDEIATKMNSLNDKSFKFRTDGGLRQTTYAQGVKIADGLQGVSPDLYAIRRQVSSQEKPLRVEEFIAMQSFKLSELLTSIAEEKNRSTECRHAVAAVLSLDYASGLRMSTKNLRQLLQLRLPFAWSSEVNDLKMTLEKDKREFMRTDSFERSEEMESIYTELLWLLDTLDILASSLHSKDAKEYFADDEIIELFLNIELELLKEKGIYAFKNSTELALAAIEEYTNH